MPRLPHHYYVQHHLALQAELDRGGRAFFVLTPGEQIAIHTFYEPTLDLNDEGLRALRRRVTKADPLLPYRAGKAYARIAPFIGEMDVPMLGGTSEVVPDKRKGEYRRITVWGEVQPHIEPEDLAKVLLQAVNEDLQRKQAEREQGEDDQVA